MGVCFYLKQMVGCAARWSGGELWLTSSSRRSTVRLGPSCVDFPVGALASSYGAYMLVRLISDSK